MREKLRVATSRGILDAAEMLLALHGPANTSMAAIAHEAGVSVGTLYNYFKDKDELVASLRRVRQEHFFALLDQALEAHRDALFAVRLEALVHTVFQFQDSQRAFLRLVFGDELPSVPRCGEEASAVSFKFMARLQKLMNSGVNSGALAADLADIYAAALGGMLRGVMVERLVDEQRSFGEAASAVVRLFLDGASKPI